MIDLGNVTTECVLCGHPKVVFRDMCRACNTKHVKSSNKRKRKDPVYRMHLTVRASIYHYFKDRDFSVSKGLEKRLGYTKKDLVAHIESQFVEGMSWENYGRGGWHLDHKIPVHHYEPLVEANISEVWRLDNLQPLWEKDNIGKKAKILPEYKHLLPKKGGQID